MITLHNPKHLETHLHCYTRPTESQLVNSQLSSITTPSFSASQHLLKAPNHHWRNVHGECWAYLLLSLSGPGNHHQQLPWMSELPDRAAIKGAGVGILVVFINTVFTQPSPPCATTGLTCSPLSIIHCQATPGWQVLA